MQGVPVGRVTRGAGWRYGGVAWLAVLVGALAAPAGASAAVHPSGVATTQELEALRARLSTPPYAEYVSALRGGMDARVGRSLGQKEFWGDVRAAGTSIGGLALAAAILDREADWTIAKEALLGSLSWSDWGNGEGDDLNRGHTLMGAAVAYDLLFHRLSASERSAVRARLGEEAARLAAAYDRRIWWATDRLQNHNWINMSAVGFTGLVLEGEDSRAASWVSKARQNWANVKPHLDAISDGSWHEGVGYGQYGWSNSMPFWLAATRSGFDVAESTALREYGRYRLATHLADDARRYVTLHGDWTGWAGPGSGAILRYVASRWQDPLAQEAARRFSAAGRRSGAPPDLLSLGIETLVFDPTVAPADLSKVPLDFYGADQQIAVMRQSWDRGGHVLALKAGVFGGRGNFELYRAGRFPGTFNFGHDHVDDLGLWWFGDGEWLLPETVGYNIGWTPGPKAWMTEFHNALLIGGIGQLGDERGPLDAKNVPWFLQREADLSIAASTAHYAFARADGTRLYPATLEPRRIVRTLAFSRDGGHALLHDDVRLGAARTVDQLFHFSDAGTRSGAWIRGNAKNDRVLGIRVVAPASFETTFANQTADKLSKQFELDGSITKATVRPTTTRAETTFLSLLWPGRGATWANRPEVQPLDAARPEAGFEARLAVGRERWIVGRDGSASAGGLALTGEIGLVRRNGSGAIDRLVLLGAGHLSENGRMLVSNPDMGVLEVELDGTTARLSGVAGEGTSFHAPDATRVLRNGAEVAWFREGEYVVLGTRDEPPPVEIPDAGTPDAGEGWDAACLPDDPEPSDPPEDPEPSDPPEDPEPTDPPEDPEPSDPPVDPEPSDPPEDPEPSDPPEEPEPTDPPEEPSEPPSARIDRQRSRVSPLLHDVRGSTPEPTPQPDAKPAKRGFFGCSTFGGAEGALVLLALLARRRRGRREARLLVRHP